MFFRGRISERTLNRAMCWIFKKWTWVGFRPTRLTCFRKALAALFWRATTAESESLKKWGQWIIAATFFDFTLKVHPGDGSLTVELSARTRARIAAKIKELTPHNRGWLFWCMHQTAESVSCKNAILCAVTSSAFVNPVHKLETADFRLGKSGKRRPRARLCQKAENLSARSIPLREKCTLPRIVSYLRVRSSATDTVGRARKQFADF